MTENNSYIAVLRHRGFLNLWINQILVQFAYNCLNFALIIWVFYLTESNIAVASLMVAVYLPSLLFGVFAGVFVDIVDRRKIILTVDFILTLIFFGMLFLKFYYFAILLSTLLINTLAQFFLPAESSAIPLIVKKRQLFLANSLFSLTYFSTFLVGFGLSGFIISLLGIDFVFALGGIVLLIAFILALRFPSITNKPNKTTHKLKTALAKKDLYKFFDEGLNEVRAVIAQIQGKPAVLSAIFIWANVQAIVGVLAVLIPSFLERVLKIHAADVSYVVILPLGVGMITGAIILGKIGHRSPRRILVGRAVFMAGVLLFLMGITPLVVPAIEYFRKPQPFSFFNQPFLSLIMAFGSFLLGAAVVSIIIPCQTVIQEHTSEEDRGKVFGLLIALMSGFSILPIIFSGILSDVFGSIPLFVAIGGGTVFLGLLILKPDFFFEEKFLPYKLRQFLGVGHWKKRRNL